MHTHLTQEERYQIQALHKAGVRQSEIARQLARSPSCICRELKRNKGQRGYRAKQAQAFCEARMRASQNARRIDEATWAFVDEKLAQTWSPEQICGYCKANNLPSVSHEWIYQRIYRDKREGGRLHLALRSQKPRRKRQSGRERRGRIANQVSIDQRPEEANRRQRFGDWEADLMIGAGHQQALVTINERVSRYSLIAKVPCKSAKNVTETIISLLTPFAASVLTITTDNGKEFAMHEQISAALDAEYYFAHPYASWERGANENMNGLIREFFPKKMSFESIAEEEIAKVMHLMNHRPRKCLGYKTPYEVFWEQIKLRHNVVAFHS